MCFVSFDEKRIETISLKKFMRKVMVFGTFDIIHKGHINMLIQAKKLGDFLVVVLACDKTIEAVKNRKSYNNEEARKQNMENIEIVDKVRFGYLEDKYKVIKEEKPDIIALGYDQNSFVDKLESKVDKNTKIVRLDSYKPHKYKTTKILAEMK